MKCTIILLALTSALAVPLPDDILMEFIRGNHAFTTSVYKKLSRTTNVKNFIYSPFSVETILALTNEGARGHTSAELIKGAALPSTKQKTRRAFNAFLYEMKRSDKNLKLVSANKIYTDDWVKLEETFKSDAATFYGSDAGNISFTKPRQGAAKINKWVEENTNSKFPNLIDPGFMSTDTDLILVNALYFGGQWVNPFDSSLTVNMKFYRTKDDAVEVKFMQQVQHFNYYENEELAAKFLELPYKGADIRMVIVLPIDQEGLTNLERHMGRLLASQPFTNQTVAVQLPRFTIKTEIHFKPVLQKLGIHQVFGTDSDLTGLSPTNDDLYVTRIIQKALINVVESGSEAADATVESSYSPIVTCISVHRTGRGDNFVANSSMVPTPTFTADHPFLFYITYYGVNIFTGRVTTIK